jgi:lambda family phage portal protein
MAIGIFSRINNAIKALQGGTVPKSKKRGYVALKGDNAITKGRARQETHGQLFSREGRDIRRICRDIVQNSDIGARCVQFKIDTIIGTEPLPKVRGVSKTAKKQIESEWKKYARKTDFAERCRLIYQERFTTGESFIVYSATDNGPVFRPVEAEQIDYTVYSATQNPENVLIIDGIEYNRDTLEVQGYHVRTAYPGSLGYQSWLGNSANRYDESRVFHSFTKTRPSQYRGISPLATAVCVLSLILDIDRAELSSKRKEAYLSFVIDTKDNDPDSVAEALGFATDETDPEGKSVIDLGTGGISLVSGVDIKTLSPERPGAPYQTFEKTLAQRATMLLGVPYSAATGDTSGSSYSTERAVAMHVKRGWVSEQRAMEKYYRWEFGKWLEWAILSGMFARIGMSNYDAIMDSLGWMHNAFEWIDPRAETDALTGQLENGVQTVSNVVAGMGRDPESHKEELDEEIADYEKRGIPHPIFNKSKGQPVPPQAATVEPATSNPTEVPTDGDQNQITAA